MLHFSQLYNDLIFKYSKIPILIPKYSKFLNIRSLEHLKICKLRINTKLKNFDFFQDFEISEYRNAKCLKNKY